MKTGDNKFFPYSANEKPPVLSIKIALSRLMK